MMVPFKQIVFVSPPPAENLEPSLSGPFTYGDMTLEGFFTKDGTYYERVTRRDHRLHTLSVCWIRVFDPLELEARNN